ncbi:hypothetical protein ABZ403_23485 [Micromonospora zamorensis]|uniref:hypothetical protein n=1 Tax=Micromonospora zamorensis TaxID=709883 RepID=UPI0033F48361
MGQQRGALSGAAPASASTVAVGATDSDGVGEGTMLGDGGADGELLGGVGEASEAVLRWTCFVTIRMAVAVA